MSSELLLYPHLGLGDALIVNAIVRRLAQQHSLMVVLCKPHNAPTESFMWRDLINLEVFSVANDEEAASARKAAQESGFQTLGLGMWSDLPFNLECWAQSFYEQAGVPFQMRWNEFLVNRQPSRELPVPDKPFCLIHEDKSRGYKIDRERLPKLPVVEIVPVDGSILFDYWGLMENAEEIHFIDSSPALLLDSLPLVKAKRRVLHRYCRKGTPPAYQNPWEEVF